MALFTALTVVLVSLACSSVVADGGLHLKSYSEDEVKGCYEHNRTLGVCFDVKTGSVKVEKPTGAVINKSVEISGAFSLTQSCKLVMTSLGYSDPLLNMGTLIVILIVPPRVYVMENARQFSALSALTTWIDVKRDFVHAYMCTLDKKKLCRPRYM